jgi:hypothetical protein
MKRKEPTHKLFSELVKEAYEAFPDDPKLRWDERGISRAKHVGKWVCERFEELEAKKQRGKKRKGKPREPDFLGEGI